MKTLKSFKNLRSFLLITMLFCSSSIFAQSLGVEETVNTFWDEIRASAGKIFAIIFLVSIFFNIGKITGGERDYKGFFVGLVLWLVSITIIVSIVAYLASLTF